jgi:NAD(P)-dependent dehydrogenase (short-subunit alcohol dehydrogenase family)
MGLSTSCRTALTALCKAISRDVAVDNVTINNLLPERIDTARQKFMAERMMKAEGITREEARRRRPRPCRPSGSASTTWNGCAKASTRPSRKRRRRAG